MNEKDFERIIKSIDKETVPPEGLKEKMFEQIMNQKYSYKNLTISKFERFIFEKPLKAACVFSIVISGILWAVMGNGYTSILISFLGIR